MYLAEGSNSDFVPITAGEVSALVNEKTRAVNADSVDMVIFEVVQGLIATFEIAKSLVQALFDAGASNLRINDIIYTDQEGKVCRMLR